MMKSTKNLLVVLLLCLLAMPAKAYEKEWLLTKNWRFHKGNINGAEMPNFDDSKWQKVRVPHDWAISGPFDKEIDKQVVRIVQNGEKEASEKTGRSGSLPWIGEGWYRTSFATPDVLHRLELIIDGAMSEPKVYVNGKFVGEWKYG
jgi:beta-galactosidase